MINDPSIINVNFVNMLVFQLTKKTPVKLFDASDAKFKYQYYLFYISKIFFILTVFELLRILTILKYSSIFFGN